MSVRSPLNATGWRAHNSNIPRRPLLHALIPSGPGGIGAGNATYTWLNTWITTSLRETTPQYNARAAPTRAAARAAHRTKRITGHNHRVPPRGARYGPTTPVFASPGAFVRAPDFTALDPAVPTPARRYNGPFPVWNDGNLKIRPPGWGVFVGFRTRYRDKRDVFDWQVVYGSPESRFSPGSNKITYTAYNYNILGEKIWAHDITRPKCGAAFDDADWDSEHFVLLPFMRGWSKEVIDQSVLAETVAWVRTNGVDFMAHMALRDNLLAAYGLAARNW